MPPPSREELLRAMKGKQLQAEAARVGVAKSGTKTALVQRILQEETRRRAAASTAPSSAPESTPSTLHPWDTKDGPRGTLVVAPLSVVFNWEQQVWFMPLGRSAVPSAEGWCIIIERFNFFFLRG
jgi:hypothetical protein